MPETHLGGGPVGYSTPERNNSFEPLNVPRAHSFSYDGWQRQEGSNGSQGPATLGMENTLDDDSVQYRPRKRRKALVEQQGMSNRRATAL
jgi:hypothetical protein